MNALDFVNTEEVELSYEPLSDDAIISLVRNSNEQEPEKDDDDINRLEEVVVGKILSLSESKELLKTLRSHFECSSEWSENARMFRIFRR